MKALVRLPLVVLVLAPAMYAQTETFDILSFTRPAGWSRVETNGILLLETRRQLPGNVEFCQIYIFPSVPGGGTPDANFHRDWDAHVIPTFRVQAPPSLDTQTEDGWTTVIGSADTMLQGSVVRIILAASTGFGRSISFLVISTPLAFQAELEKFFKDADLKAPPARGPSAADALRPGPGAGEDSVTQPEPAPGGGLENYQFETPPSWTAQQMQQGMVLLSPMYSNGERCQLTLVPMRSSPGPLADEAIGFFRQAFQADPLQDYPSGAARMARGTSPQGWEYFSIRKLVGGQSGDSRTMGVIVLVARVDTQLATVVGVSKDFLISNCFGELIRDAWPQFFASLKFKNARPSNQAQSSIRQRLAGSWIMATGSVGLGYVFLPNGRYQTASAWKGRARISDTTVEETTNEYFGDGSYSFEGNNLVLTRNDRSRSVMSFRLEQVSKDSGVTWVDQLCTLDAGATGEVCYRRQ